MRLKIVWLIRNVVVFLFYFTEFTIDQQDLSSSLDGLWK